MTKKRTSLTYFWVGLIIFSNATTFTSCLDGCLGDYTPNYKTSVSNKTEAAIYFNHYYTENGVEHLRNEMPPCAVAKKVSVGFLLPPYRADEFMTLEFRDSVIEIRPMITDESGVSRNVFSFRNVGNEDNYEYYYEFTDEYITEIADTMRKLGVEPYRLSKEVVKNSSSKDFTLGIVTPNKTYEYEVKSGDETEIEMKWLMESEDTCGLHRYDFSFKDSTLTVYPFVTSGERLQTHRFFSAETTREGGGKRTYEITDKMFSEMDKEMRKIKEVRPWIFK